MPISACFTTATICSTEKRFLFTANLLSLAPRFCRKLALNLGQKRGSPSTKLHRSWTDMPSLNQPGQVEWRVDVALFFIAAHVQVLMVGPPVSESVDKPGITMEVENNGFVDCEK